MPSFPDDRPDSGPPLWAMGLVVLLMIVTPLIIYSIAPSGPIREGDTIFSEGSITVPLAHPLLYDRARFDGSCLLDPEDPLMVITQPVERVDGLILAKVQGKTMIEWPFCPPQAEVLLTMQQITQKPALLGRAAQRVSDWLKLRR
ncbi:conserved protein of unknown function [Nitrospira japonica]|uniref:Uncharacterized protein n=1 Tax=Nitrospira japonica TaxID=1325564 RepID=A0A1W1I3V3_9BACT|nr:hypothetical protein [Nitrospira japonica]SLM47688.1 conserved protein of unknown function [Nitrospira japonica]